MVKPPYIDEYGMKKGAWSQDEDNKLRASIEKSGHRNWRLVPVAAGLKRCGKSCRLRWMNYLKPGLKRGNFTKQEDELITELHSQHGNKWSAIASNFPDRTDNDIKNYYHAHIKKRKLGATTRAIRPELPRQEEQTSDSNSCITNDLDQEKPTASSEFVFHEENIGDVESDADRAPYGMGIDLGQFSIPYDYSDGEIAYWNYSTAIFSQVDLGGEECFGMGFW